MKKIHRKNRPRVRPIWALSGVGGLWKNMKSSQSCFRRLWMELQVHLNDAFAAERPCAVSGRKRHVCSQSNSLGNSPLLDFLECLQTGWWWAWRYSTHCVTHELCEPGDVVCPNPSPDCHNMGDSRSPQKQCGIFSVLVFFIFFLLRKRWKSWICWNTDVLKTLVLHFLSTPNFCQNQPSCSKCFEFCQ